MGGRMNTIREIAERFAVSTRTIYRLVDSGKLDAVNVGHGIRRHLRVTDDALEYFLSRNNPEYGWPAQNTLRRRRNRR
mgnify:FL=1|jgi:excisionase family DNA binding protein